MYSAITNASFFGMKGGFMFTAILLAVSAVAATPAQHQRVAAALYQVTVSYNAEGLFIGAMNEEGISPMSEHADGTLTIGSAFAVSADGWLMTARHVVDPGGGLRDLCERLGGEWPGAVMLRHATLTMLFEDIAGTTYGVVARLEPETAGENLCMPGGTFTIAYDETTTARITAFDTISDLALVSIDAKPILHLSLSRQRPDRWSELFAVGYTDPGQRMVRGGAVAIRCEQTSGPCALNSDTTQTCTDKLVMRTTAAVQPGMSGSPQVGHGGVVGITTMQALSAPIGFAIPATYASAWYRHVRWPKKYSRPTTVCVPTPEQ
jgi:S1-C subfamily serine protease